ncbi:MAG: hypothetical protein K6U08_02430 [Firmicutes bacterium]|nr:hypothetical protein [Bacillota bacterium]
MDLSRVPLWVWVLLGVLVVVSVPLKLRVWKSLLTKKSASVPEEEE